jgi:hypothetical protein
MASWRASAQQTSAQRAGHVDAIPGLRPRAGDRLDASAAAKNRDRQDKLSIPRPSISPYHDAIEQIGGIA